MPLCMKKKEEEGETATFVSHSLFKKLQPRKRKSYVYIETRFVPPG